MWNSLSDVKILYIKLFQFIFLTFFHIQRIFSHILDILHTFFTLYSFFLWITHFFIHSIIHSIMRCKYSFKEFIHSKILANHSFNKFIHSKKSEIIHSKQAQTIMRCDHKLLFQQFLLTNINHDDFTNISWNTHGHLWTIDQNKTLSRFV